MENSKTSQHLSGALLIHSLVSAVGIISAIFFSGYLAIILGILALGLLIATNNPESKRDRIIATSLATLSVLLGVGAIALGMIARSITSQI